jgi:hypothetical protein
MPVELLGLEATVAAEVDGKPTGVAVYQRALHF